MEVNIKGDSSWDDDDDDNIERVVTPFIEVECLGLAPMDRDKCSSVKVKVKAIAGLGGWLISPCAWFDDVAHIHAAQEREQRKQSNIKTIAYIDTPSMGISKRERLTDYISTMDEPKRKKMEAEIKERYKSMGKIPASAILDLAICAVCLQESIEESSIDKYMIRNYRD